MMAHSAQLQRLQGRSAIGAAADRAATSLFRPFVGPVVVSHQQHQRCADGSAGCSRSRTRGTAVQAAHPDFRAYFGSQQQQEQEEDGSTSKHDLLQPLLFFSVGSDAAGGQVPPSPEQLAEVLPLLSPRQLADAIWGFAKQGIQPAQDVMDAIASEVLSKLEHFRSADLSNTVWALAVLKYQPSATWWEAFERQVYQHLTDFSDREAANLMWSLAVLDHRPAWVLEPLLASALDALPHYSPNALHLLGWSCGKLGYCPSAEWLDGYLRAAQASFFQFSPSEMSNIVWSLTKLVPGMSRGPAAAGGSRQQHDDDDDDDEGGEGAQQRGHQQQPYKLPALWLDNFLMVTQWRFPSFSAKTLSVVAWAVASLGHTPSQEWLVLYEQQVREKFWDLSGQELACIAWALRRFGAPPEHNAVFYMLARQEAFLQVDFDILSNSKLLGQVHQWRHEGGGAGASLSSSSAPALPPMPSSSTRSSSSSSGGAARGPPSSLSPAPAPTSLSGGSQAPPPQQQPPQQQQQGGEQGPPSACSSTSSSLSSPQQQQEPHHQPSQQQGDDLTSPPPPPPPPPGCHSEAQLLDHTSVVDSGAGAGVLGGQVQRPLGQDQHQGQGQQGNHQQLPPA